VYLVAANYGSLPDEIPNHFNLRGEPDDWSGKGTILLLPGLAAFMYLLMTGISVALALVRDPMSMINLPRSRKEAIGVEQAEKLRVLVVRVLFLMKLLLTGMMAYLAHATVEVAFERWTSLGLLFYLFIVAILGAAAFLVWKALSLAAGPKPQGPFKG